MLYGDGVPVTGPFIKVSYTTVEVAQCYFDGRLHSDSWDCASDKDRAKALIDATRRIDRLSFAGLRTSDYNSLLATLSDTGVLTAVNIILPSTPGQPLEFPRDGNTTVPQEVISACCEIALALLDGVDPEMEMQSLPSIHQGFAAVRETYDPNIARLAYRHGIPSYTAWTYLLPFLADPTEFSLRRTN